MRVRNRRPLPHSGQERLTPPCTGRLAALARLNLTHAHPPLALPTLSGRPGGYSGRRGDEMAIALAATAVKAGLGSITLWEQANGDCALFLRAALNEWLSAKGAAALADTACFHFEITTNCDGVGIPSGLVLASLESENAGDLALGPGLARMEARHPGLGRDFYLVLLRSLWLWMPTYDLYNAEEMVERWKENTEFDREPGTEETFEAYCEREDLHFPDIEGETPVFLRSLYCGKTDEAVTRLEGLDGSGFDELIADVLELHNLKPAFDAIDPRLDGAWEDGPLPAWLIRFERNDAIEQCFDEECETFLETFHQPLWTALFPPASVEEFRRVLADVEGFLKVNLLLKRIKEQFSEMEPKDGNRDHSRSQRRKRTEL